MRRVTSAISPFFAHTGRDTTRPSSRRCWPKPVMLTRAIEAMWCDRRAFAEGDARIAEGPVDPTGRKGLLGRLGGIWRALGPTETARAEPVLISVFWAGCITPSHGRRRPEDRTLWCSFLRPIHCLRMVPTTSTRMGTPSTVSGRLAPGGLVRRGYLHAVTAVDPGDPDADDLRLPREDPWPAPWPRAPGPDSSAPIVNGPPNESRESGQAERSPAPLDPGRPLASVRPIAPDQV